MRFAFFSLQGLGNSIINFPILNQLRRTHEVNVVAFNNGSAAFFRSFHPNVAEVGSRWQLLKTARRLEAEGAFVCYPTWRRELSSGFLSPAPVKYVMRCERDRWAQMLLDCTDLALPDVHNLENNIRLLKHVPGVSDAENLDLREAFGLGHVPEQELQILGVHPTASTPAKYYPLQFWVSLLNEMSDTFKEIHLFCGGRDEELSFCNEIATKLRLKSQIHSALDFGALVRLIDSTTCFVGSDSALMHLAAMMDKKTIGLWSFANFRVIYPYGNRAHVYLPQETLDANVHEYPDRAPEYFTRASFARVAEIVLQNPTPSFEIEPEYKNPVRFYEY